jgi:mono/diheme cytochrome c family protein
MPRTVVNLSRTFAGAALAFTPGAAPALAGDDAQIKRGAEVYAAQKCQMCHAIAGKGNKLNPLDGVGKKLTADDIRQWIVAAPEMTEKTKAARKPLMRSYPKLSKDDLDALVAYLQSLKG